MSLCVNIAPPFVVTGNVDYGRTNNSKKNIKIFPKTEPKSEVKELPKNEKVSEQAPQSSISRKEYSDARQKVNSLVCPLFKSAASEQEVFDYIMQFKDKPELQAWVISQVITAASNGLGTNEDAFRAGIYSIKSKDIYNAVNEHNIQYREMDLTEQIDDEMSEEEGRDLHRHINQFK